MDRRVVPPLHGHDREGRAVAHDDLDVLGQLRRALVPQHDDRLAVLLRLDHEVRIGPALGALARDAQDDRLGQRGVLAQQREHFDALRPEDGAGLARVQQALRTPPLFLDGQGTQKLDALQADVERRLEENEVLQIEVLFSRITSPERRQACLERLRQLSGLTLA